MDELTSIAALDGLIETVAGKHESAAVKADLALVGSAVSLLTRALLPKIDPAIDLTALDAALAKAFGGIDDTIRAIEGVSAPAAPASDAGAAEASTAAVQS